MRGLFFLPLLILSTAPALAQKVADVEGGDHTAVSVGDDPFRSNAIYSLPIAGSGRATLDADNFQVTLMAAVDRNDHTQTWMLGGYVIYRDDWRYYNSARLRGGRELRFRPNSRRVVSCSNRPCLLSEGFMAEVDQPALASIGSTGRLDIEIAGQRGQPLVVQITADEMSAIRAAIAAHPPARP